MRATALALDADRLADHDTEPSASFAYVASSSASLSHSTNSDVDGVNVNACLPVNRTRHQRCLVSFGSWNQSSSLPFMCFTGAAASSLAGRSSSEASAMLTYAPPICST